MASTEHIEVMVIIMKVLMFNLKRSSHDLKYLLTYMLLIKLRMRAKKLSATYD